MIKLVYIDRQKLFGIWRQYIELINKFQLLYLYSVTHCINLMYILFLCGGK